ncbi:alpha/beta fold hydrolase [Crossiella cryophila]|uniref:Pimeloyl-ACP methyl ester carboxylesterase n=1 Tax=Crossiella cryophila TaxID=43355 RepID=A0A7W7CF46_9PSEU|nr:alpha/beta hydrolase [Crossiella cryophila]MBB4679832.1 pimeloyl-ACP methyl ester carboxylesterase [Crossiella cryophila]
MSPERALDPGPGLTEHRVVLPDGRRIRTVTAGEGPGPLVVFEAGMSAPAASWVHTQREISTRHRTLSYDRAGYGGSDLDPADRTLERLVDDLTDLLDVLAETDPVVLVGHSWGGPIARLFADRHPDRVAGLVFVDATLAGIIPEDQAGRIRRTFQLMSVLAGLGGSRLIMRLSLPHGTAAEISQSDLEIIRRDYACGRAMRAGGREARQILPALQVLRRLQEVGTPAVPTICLQAGRIDRGMATVRPALNQLATELMSLAPKGKAVIVEQAGHLIPQECPAAVREAVLEVVDAVTEVR